MQNKEMKSGGLEETKYGMEVPASVSAWLALAELRHGPVSFSRSMCGLWKLWRPPYVAVVLFLNCRSFIDHRGRTAGDIGDFDSRMW